ncbi:aurora kinase 2 splicing [Colletotrichum asianum]|uniref:Aurora kinase 2 splicing n=1 Tax=Colletotrichum asianum TaxID=702518 RepID=A0A8H3W500_9PEZI|nr:aurora kinase 2 splicing [Colletotrichum asianum]
MFKITRNIVYYSLTKSKYIIRSILASKVYAIIVSINIVYTIAITLILTIIYIDSYLLYKYFIKLSIIKEKYLIINIIVI